MNGRLVEITKGLILLSAKIGRKMWRAMITFFLKENGKQKKRKTASKIIY